MIEFKNVTKYYNEIKVIDKLNLTVNDGEFVVMIGSSGCGKTTTLKMINRLIESNSGDIFVNGNNIKDVDIIKLRTEIGYVIQEIGLFPNMTIEENICVVPKIKKWSKEQCKQRAKELLGMVGMPYDDYAAKYPNELSGGQQQRVGVLRALAARPGIVLMDEPFGALDPITRSVLQDEVKNIQKRLNVTIVFITHDMSEAVKLADSIVFMDKGRILQTASPEEMMHHPANNTIREFMGKKSVEQERKFLCADIMTPVDVAKHFENDPEWMIFENDSAQNAYHKMQQQNADYLLVINDDLQTVGSITRENMMRILADMIWGDVS